MNKSSQEHHDYYTYHSVHFHRDTLEFFYKAATFYYSIIDDNFKMISKNDFFNALFSQDELISFPINIELQKVSNVCEWLKNIINSKNEDQWYFDIDISHGTVRFLKSISIIFIEHLRQNRNKIALNPNISKFVIEAIDQKLSHLEEKIHSGVFRNASPYPLLLDQLPNIESEFNHIENSSDIKKYISPPPVFVDSIEIFDQELRRRCLDLFAQFKKDGQHDRLDTVLAEATRILEDRIRKLSNASQECTGVELAKYAFGQKEPPLIVSNSIAEQEAAHLLFRGVFGFIRNRVHHHIVETLIPERVLQIVAMVDFLLFIAESAQRKINE